MRDGLEVLLEKIPINGMSKKCQKFLPSIAQYYFDGKQPEDCASKFGKKNVNLVYSILNQIKINGLKKISGVLAKHPKDIENDVAFADAIIEYSFYFKNLKKEIFKIFNKLDRENKNSLNQRYKKNKKLSEDYRSVQVLARTPNFYVFIVDKILDKNALFPKQSLF